MYEHDMKDDVSIFFNVYWNIFNFPLLLGSKIILTTLTAK